jgi:iron complex outermembrane recepter protein
MNPNYISNLARLLPLCLASAAPLTMHAQAAANTAPETTPQPASEAQTSDDIIELSPFVVETSNDVGYMAQNSLAGTRLNTSLMDTAASVSVYTPEFLKDIAATNMKDVILFTNDAVPEYGDSASNYNGNPMIGSDEWLLRIRGIEASYARNYFESYTPTDFYNVSRVDQSRGPNSILFGFGSAGGIVNSTTKQAILSPIENEVTGSIGSWDRSRETIDYNQVLIEDKLAIRINAVNEENNSWRDYEFYESKRIDLAATWKVTENSTMRGEFENGRIKDSVARTWLMIDQTYAWKEAGSPIYDSSQWNSDIVAQTWSTHEVYIENDGTLMNWEYTPYSYSDTEGWSHMAMTSDNLKLIPIETNSAGPGAYRTENFNNGSLWYEIRATDDLDIEIAYNHQYSTFLGYDANGSDLTTYTYLGDATCLFADACSYLPTWTESNPYAGKYYIENNWTRRYITDKADNLRATASYHFDLGPIGDHRLAVMLQRSWRKSLNLEECEVLDGCPFADDAEADENRLFRRYYITTGDSSKIRATSWELPVVNMLDPVTGKTLTSTWVPDQEINNSDQTQDTIMTALQSGFWNNRFATTLGYRHDWLDYSTLRTTRNDDGVLVLDPDDEFNHTFNADTFSVGLVYHATDNISLFANHSNSNKLPNTSQHLYGYDVPPMSDGLGSDFGVKLNFFGGKLYATINYYTTDFNKTTEWGDVETYSDLNNRILNKLVSEGLISQSDADSRYTDFDSYLEDRKSEGWEAEIIANPDEHWRFTLNASINHVKKSSIMSEIVAWAKDAEKYWLEKGGSATYALSSSSWDILGGDGENEGQIDWMNDYINSETAFNDKQARGEREFGGSFYVRYLFTENFLKGFYIGGGMRYQGKNAVDYEDTDDNGTLDTLIKGNDLLLFDAMAGYDFKLRDGDRPITASIQLNVSNVFDDDTYQIYTMSWWNSSIPERIGLQEPRKFTFTTSIKF